MPEFNVDFISLSDLLQIRAKESPNEIFIVSETDSITYEQCDCMVETMARNLHRLGITSSRRVAVLFRRTPRLILSFLALIRTGAYPVPVNFYLSTERLYELLGYLKPHVLMGENRFMNLIEPHVNVLPPRKFWIITDIPESPSIPFTELEHSSKPVRWPTALPEDTCYIDTTSGTSGNPKGVLTTHKGIAANAFISTSTLNIGSSDIHYGLFAPFAHVHEVLSRVLLTGGAMVLHDTLHPRSISRMIRRSGATVLMAVPALYSMVLKKALCTLPTGTLRLLESGGGITPESLIHEYSDLTGVPITPVWGSTETAGIAIAGTELPYESRGYLGSVCTGYDYQLVDDEDLPVNGEAEGELLLRGEAIMKGYFDLPEETRHVLKSGWYHTGDIFQQNKHGLLRFRGRKSEMIKYHGHKIHPLEIEGILEMHPDIRRAAVIGVQSNDGEELPVAVLAPLSGNHPNEQELRVFCRRFLAGYKIPRSFIFRKTLPMTSSGKLIKKGLLQEREDGI